MLAGLGAGAGGSKRRKDDSDSDDDFVPSDEEDGGAKKASSKVEARPRARFIDLLWHTDLRLSRTTMRLPARRRELPPARSSGSTQNLRR